MVRIIPITDKKTWENFVCSIPQANFLHSYLYGQTNKDIGKSVYFDGIYKDGSLVGVSLAVVERAKRGKHLVIAGGPLIPWQDKSVVAAWLKAIKETAKKEHCVFVRIRPQLPDIPQNRKLFANLGFKPSPMHVTADHTLQLDLSLTPEEVMAQMRKTTRYEIRKAEKLEISVTTSTDPVDIKKFQKIQLETASRHGFIPFSEKFIASEFRNFTQAGQALLYTASLNKTLLAQALVIFYPTEASYHFGASTEDGRKLPGAYLIQWEAIKEAKARGIPRYNFWGIVGENQKAHRFFGVSLFKRGFGGMEVKYLPAHDLVINPLLYYPVFLFEKLRKKIRKLE